MTPEANNALRSVARKCRSDIIKATKDKPRSQHDPIITALLEQHAKSIQCLPPGTFPAKRWLAYFVSVIDKALSK